MEIVGGKPERRYVRDNCARCGKCAESCYSNALTTIGEYVAAGAVIAEVKKDDAFYQTSGGGVTLSGGEPFFQPAFALALLKLAKSEGLHTCADTCGAVDYAVLEEAADYTDMFLYDVKETDPVRHTEHTGVSNERILENLFKLDAAGARIALRCPIIPGVNDREDHFKNIGGLANRLKHVTGVDVAPYHPLGISKADAVGKPAAHRDAALPPKQTAEHWAASIQKYTSVKVTVL